MSGHRHQDHGTELIFKHVPLTNEDLNTHTERVQQVSEKMSQEWPALRHILGNS